jgi:hypothetical protein
MKDIVEEALAANTRSDHTGTEGSRKEASEFGEPIPALVGCGNSGARVASMGWDDRSSDPGFPDAPTVSVLGEPTPKEYETDYTLTEDTSAMVPDVIPDVLTTADYAIVTTALDDSMGRSLAVELLDTLPDDVTTVAIPMLSDGTDACECATQLSDLTATANMTIPIDTAQYSETSPTSFPNFGEPTEKPLQELTATLVREFATDLVSILAKRVPFSAPAHEIHEAISTAGLTTGFRGWTAEYDTECSADRFASDLLSQTRTQPLSTPSVSEPSECLAFVLGSQELTLAQTEAIRDAIPSALALDLSGTPLLTADTTTTAKPCCRLTVLVPGLSVADFADMGNL